MGGPAGNCHNPNGAPKKNIDWNLFEDLCGLQCTQSEIASILKVHPNTLSDRVFEKYEEDYSTTYKKYSECGKVSLRRYQFIQAKKNPSMAIWLGKQWLDQKDKQETINSPETLSLLNDWNEYLKMRQLQSSALKNLDKNDSKDTQSE